MKRSGLLPEHIEGIRCDRVGNSSLNAYSIGAELCEKANQGYRLRCGEFSFWSVPLEFLFTPRKNELTHVVTVHAEIFVLAHEDAKMGQILSKTLNTIDGRVLQGICKVLYPHHKILRQNGANFILDLAEYCLKHSERLFLLGSSKRANCLATRHLRDLFPRLQVSGFSPSLGNYPFDENWNNDILGRVESFRPHHLVVCFGPKKQEYWIHENSHHLTRLGVCCAYGLGATIDFLAKTKPRAPKWIEFIGAEWLFRFACEPRARFLRTLIMFKMPFYALRTVREISSLNEISLE